MVTKTNPVKCTGSKLLPDSRLQFTFEKGSDTLQQSAGTKVVVNADIALSMNVDGANTDGYTVGKQYNLQLTPLT